MAACRVRWRESAVRGPSARRLKPVVQTVGDLLDRQHSGLRGRQLDGQRHAVEPRADGGDGRRRLGGQREPRVDRRRSVGEEACRLRGQVKGRHGRGDLTGNAERLPAGGEDVQVGAGVQEVLDEDGARIDQMLTVVEHEQQSSRRQVVAENAGQRPSGLLPYLESSGHGLCHQGRIGQRRQLDQPDPVVEDLHQLAGRDQREPGLSRAARAGQADQSVLPEQTSDLGELRLAADEAADLRGQVVTGA